MASEIVRLEASTSALNLIVHPLVIINISDHYTRKQAQTKTKNPRVVGALIGEQHGRDVEIESSYEVPFNVVDGKVVMDVTYLKAKIQQLKTVNTFRQYDVLGWYSTGADVVANDLEVHQRLVEAEACEAPLFLLLNCTLDREMTDLPMQVFESELRIINDAASSTSTSALVFVRAEYKIESGEAERIAVDHVAHISAGGNSGVSSISTHITGLQNAVIMLSRRLAVLIGYAEQMKKGEIPMDHVLLRQINSLVSRLPAMSTKRFSEEFVNEYNDALLATFLATVTKGINTTNELIDKFNIIVDRPGGGRHRSRAFF